MSATASAIVVVFDFDKTIIEDDSDKWMIEGMGGTQIFNELYPILPWNSLMDRIMIEIQSQEKTVADMENCLRRVPLHSNIISAIKSAHSLGCDLRIVSDANMFFIKTILKNHGVIDCFSEINTNPNFIDEDGKLRILPFHDFNSHPHDCNFCPSNLCKGQVIDRIRSSILDREGKKKIIYVGDGRNDFCPSKRLGEDDHVLPKKNFPLWNLITRNPSLVKAKIREWSNSEELELFLLGIINNK